MRKTAIALALLAVLLPACQTGEPQLSSVEIHPLSTAWEKDDQLPHTYRIGAGDVAWVALGCDPARPLDGIRLNVRSVKAAPMQVMVVPSIPLDESAGAIGEYQRLIGWHMDTDPTPRPLFANAPVSVDAGFYVNMKLRSDYFIRPFPVRDGSGFAFELIVTSEGKREVLPIRFYFAMAARE